MLIVGIPNALTRTFDFTPSASGSNPLGASNSTSGIDRLATFVIDEVLPAIRSQDHTLPYTVLAGDSLGGWLTSHAAATRPGVFTAGIAMSPSRWWLHPTQRVPSRSTAPPFHWSALQTPCMPDS